MYGLFDLIVVILLRNEGTIAKTILKSVAEFRELCSFSLLGGYGSYNQHQGDG